MNGELILLMDCPVCLHEIEVHEGVEVVECPHCDTVVAVGVEDEEPIGV